MKLIKDYKFVLTKAYSMYLAYIGALVSAICIYYPDAILHVWANLPHDLKEALPYWVVPTMSLSVFVTQIVAIIIEQKRK